MNHAYGWSRHWYCCCKGHPCWRGWWINWIFLFTVFSQMLTKSFQKSHKYWCLPVPPLQACSLEFAPNASSLRGDDDGRVCCPRCGSTALHRQQRQQPPPIFLTPSGLVMTEDVLRQLVGFNAGLYIELCFDAVFYIHTYIQFVSRCSLTLQARMAMVTVLQLH